MTLILANKCTWWQVHSALVYMIKYQISMLCTALMYMPHNHMVYGELHILPYLVLDQNANDNACLSPLSHEVWNVYHRRVMLGIDLCYNTFSHLWVPQMHYPEHDNFFLSILFPWIFFLVFLERWHHWEMWIMLSVLLENVYLTKTIKKHLS